MGGKAFTSGITPLHTPRMPPEVYHSLRDHCLCLLSSLYEEVATPIEAPAKISYGDIDVLVSRLKSTFEPPATQTIAKALSAVRTLTIPGSPTTSFAIPYPNRPDAYVQVDVHLCPPGSFRWQLFFHSHGDLWNLLGTTIRPFGLTATDAGLHLRIPEIEELNRKRGMLFMTRQPDEVLDFLGLDPDVYAQPFESVEAMYQSVVECRFFRASTYVRDELKANDRKRMAQREIFSRFVSQWLPDNVAFVKTRPRESIPWLMREHVQEAALSKWGAKEAFETRVEEWKRERRELLGKQKGRQKRKDESLKMEKYVGAWMSWLDRNGNDER